jgi:tetratricopeptide (TPR) repeat protein
MAGKKRKKVLNAALKSLLAGAETSAAIKIPATFISELAGLSDDKQKALAELPQEQFNALLTQTELATLNAADAAAGTKQIKALIKELSAKVDTLTIKDKREKGITRTQNLPYFSIGGLFKGREDLFGRLESALGAGKTTAITQVQAIHGLGGIGKTRLAVEYAWRALENGQYTAVFFVVAETEGSLHTNLAALASPALLDLPEQNSAEQPIIVEAVLAELGRRADWLMIFDNVDSDEAAGRLHKQVLPRLAGGNVLITSRRSNWPDEVADLSIDKLDEADAAAYLLEKTEGKRAKSAEDEALAKEIARELDGLPVALEQAAAYVCQRRIGFGAYLKDFKESREKVLSWYKGEVNYPVAVLAAWETTKERLGPCEQGILGMAAFLGPEAIPAGLFESQAKRIEESAGLVLEETAAELKIEEGEIDVRDLLAELADWSMINLAEESFTMHRLVQDSIRLSIPEDRRKTWAKLALELVNQHIPSDPPPNDVRSWDIWEPAESHVAAIVAHADDLGIGEPTTRLMNGLGFYFKTRARFDEAEPMYRRALAIDEQSFDEDHPKVAIRLNNLAQLLHDTNRLAEAEPLMRRAMVIDEQAFGEDHPKVAIRLNNLAQLLQDTNRLDEAEPLMRRALEIDEQAFGEDHPDVAIDLNNLAALLQDTNRLAEAEPLMRRALAVDEQAFGEDHPDVAIDLNNLATLLQDTNRLAEAEPLMRRALAVDEQSFGEDHPKVAIRLNNLATLLQDTNRLVEAEPLMVRVVEIMEKSYDTTHPKVAIALNNLAQLLQATNRLAEAEPLMNRALAIDEQSLGKDHPSVARDLNNLALLLEATNRLAEAKPLMRRALEIFEKSLGPDHPNTQMARGNLEGLK